MVNEDTIIKAIGGNAAMRVGQLAAELVRAEPDGKEAVLAEIEFFRWIEGACEDSLRRDPSGPF